MRNISRFCLGTSFAAVLCFLTISCSKNSAPQPSSQTESSDPAQANLAPVSQQQPQTYSAPQPANPPQPAASPQQQASYPAQDASYAPPEQSSSYPDDNDFSAPPVYADQPPPPIPQYSQPECPGPNYLWTPGTWNYASAGYYWVPGVWVMAPFVGALWTPPYWGFQSNRYIWHHGYWGSHIGFYGGINYGFGYVGRGYEGGYWNRNQFAYNRTVNNVNVSVVRNVYNYRVTNITNVRTSYVGGRGGLDLRPTPAELAVMHERRIAPLPQQVQHIQQAAANRSQFAEVNHGRPENAVAAHPLETPYHAPAARAAQVPGARTLPEANPRAPQAVENKHAEPAPVSKASMRAGRQPENEARPNPQPRTEPKPVQPKVNEPATRAEPARTQAEPAHPRPEHAEPERRPATEARPEPPRPAEKPRPEQKARPEPKSEAKPELRREDHPPLA